MVKVDYVDVVRRAFWTFVQALLAQVTVAGTGWVSLGLWKAAAISGGAAVLSFLKNWAVQTFGEPTADARR